MHVLLKVAGWSFVAGFVDTVGFIALFGLFTAHVTGNFVLIGASIAGESAGALAKLLALPVFVLTVVAVTLAVRRGEAHGGVKRGVITVAQIAFLAAFMIAGGLLGPFTNPDGITAIPVGLLGVAAMGVQNATSRLLDTGPPTTIMTGNTTQAIIDLVDLARGGVKDGTGARLRGLLGATGAFAAGAILGALGYLAAGYWSLAAPIRRACHSRDFDRKRRPPMSWQPHDDPAPGDKRACEAIDTIIVPRARDLGSFSVRRALPSAQRQMIGPFIFFDQMGPAEFLLHEGMDVRPHPHIGLSTVTYLFDGEIYHRDSLGTALPIRPGELNWMTAGRGITHSERTAPELRATGSKLFGIQSWVALSAKDEEIAPAFEHYDAPKLPIVSGEGKMVRVIAGAMLGAASPVRTSSAMFYADVQLETGAAFPHDPDYDERAIYTVSGDIDVAGDAFGPGQLLVFKPGDRITIRAKTPARFMALGGEPMDGPRHIWWNFVSSRRDRIEQAKADWKAARFDTVPGDSEFIPLPE